MQSDTHVRVDIFYANLTQKKQALINITGFVIFILPISLLVAYYGIGYSFNAFEIGEISGDPGGLTHRFIIKSVIPLSFILVIISGFIFAHDNYKNLKGEST
ncbi:TRAP dicarboxylate transporter, DctQ subunit, unknown substrate 6 [uncultured Candidatus Thioglobus sp.]|nr:TRAP dicarboxylate transporter, DctQ subunit, unknown substrate 6 [uncultured Candidatus Thioglobus sp.]